MPDIKTFADVEAALTTFRPNTMVPVLHTPQHTPELMEFLGNPQDSYKVIHVAGTSGKTSTAYFAAALLQAAGKRVGLTISPHAECINERAQIDLQPLTEAEFCADFQSFLEVTRPSGIPLNYFQAITSFALWEFARKGVEYAVVEVGIGGLADSTNVFRRPDKICVINDIGYAHMHILGDTLTEIAANKAGIIQLQNPVFCRQQSDEIMAPVRDQAQRMHADLHIVREISDFDFLPLFQRRNFAMSEAAVRFALERDGGVPLSAAAIETAAHTTIPARMEMHPLHGKTVVLDGAHNPQKLQALVGSIQAAFPQQTVAVLLGCGNASRDALDDLAAALRPLNAHVIASGFPPDVRGRFGSADVTQVAAALRRQDIDCEVCTDPAAAFKLLQTRNEPVHVVTGSFFLLNHIRPLVAQAELLAARATAPSKSST